VVILKGVVPALSILLILGGVVGAGGLAVAADKISGKNIGPESPIYGIERAGEAIQKAFGMISDDELRNERSQEAARLDELASQKPGKADTYRKQADDLRQKIISPISGKP